MRIIALCLLLALSACSTVSPQTAVLESCSIYGRSLGTLAAARFQGRLTMDQIATVDATNAVVVPICTAPVPPADAIGTLESANRTLEALIFQSGVK